MAQYASWFSSREHCRYSWPLAVLEMPADYESMWNRVTKWKYYHATLRQLASICTRTRRLLYTDVIATSGKLEAAYLVSAHMVDL